MPITIGKRAKSKGITGASTKATNPPKLKT